MMQARLKFLLPLLLVGAVFALYWPSLHFEPFFDDKNFFERAGLNFIFLRGFEFELRWLPYFATAWIDLIFEDHVFAQRSINVGLHVLIAYVLYAFIRQVADHVAPHRNNARAALAAALLFLLHPLAVYAVGYMIQRTILMATLFGLLALNTYFDGLRTGKRAYFLFSALFYFLSAFSKEHAVLIPAAALALTPLAGPVTRRTWRQLVLPVVLYTVIALLVVYKSQSNLGRVYEPFAEQLVQLHGGQSPAELWMLSVLTQATLYFKYLGLMLLPNPAWMSIDMRVPFAEHAGQLKYWLGAGALLGYVAFATVWLFKGGRRGLVGYALLAPLLLFAVEFSTVRIQEPFVLYRSYLWLPVFLLMLPALTYAIPGKIFWTALLLVALGFAWASNDRLQSFSSEYALWDDAVRKLPHALAHGSARTYHNRGYLNMKRGDPAASIADFTSALRVNPAYKKSLQNRAFVYMKEGRFDEAMADAKAVLALYPDDRDNYTLRGVIYRAQGQLDLAMADFKRSCEMKSIGACAAVQGLQEAMQATATRP